MQLSLLCTCLPSPQGRSSLLLHCEALPCKLGNPCRSASVEEDSLTCTISTNRCLLNSATLSVPIPKVSALQRGLTALACDEVLARSVLLPLAGSSAAGGRRATSSAWTACLRFGASLGRQLVRPGERGCSSLLAVFLHLSRFCFEG